MKLAPSLRALATSALFALVLAGTSSADPGRIAGAPLVYLRSGPGTDTRPITRLSEGDRLEILTIEGDWVNVATEDDHTGWVYGSFVERLEPTPAPTPEPTPAPDEIGPAKQLFEEVAYLRAELAELRREVERRQAESAKREAAGTAAFEEEEEEASPAQPFGLPRILVWGFWFVVGAVSSSVVITVRRARSQRSRLRF